MKVQALESLELSYNDMMPGVDGGICGAAREDTVNSKMSIVVRYYTLLSAIFQDHADQFPSSIPPGLPPVLEKTSLNEGGSHSGFPRLFPSEGLLLLDGDSDPLE